MHAASYGYVPSSSILATLMKEALSSSETFVFTRATRRNIPEDAVFLSHCRKKTQILQSCEYFSSIKYLEVLEQLHN
jgi:hypothetical protein